MKIKFLNSRQRPTPVATASDLLFIIGKLPHKYISDFEKERDTLTARYLGGDTSLSREVAVIRTHQESLPQNHPMRVFGEAVESGQIGHMNDDPVYLDERHEARAKAINGYHEHADAVHRNPATNNQCAHIRSNAEISRAALGIYPRELRSQLDLRPRTSSRNYMDVKQLEAVSLMSHMATDLTSNTKSTGEYNTKVTEMTGSLYPIFKKYNVHGYKGVSSLSRPQLLIESGEEDHQTRENNVN
jgi:hypothetical protein